MEPMYQVNCSRDVHIVPLSPVDLVSSHSFYDEGIHTEARSKGNAPKLLPLAV